MSEVRDLRRETRQALEEERRRGEQQIARLREENRKEIQRLETEQEEQLASYRQQLRELEKRQAEAVRLAENRVQQRLAEEQREIRQRMDRLSQETQQKLEEQSRVFSARLQRMYDQIDARVNEIMRKLAELEHDEQTLAREKTEEAKSAFEAVTADGDVRDFAAETVRLILEPMVNTCIRTFNLGQWAAATGKAMIAVIECQRCRIEAEMARKTWETRFASARNRLTGLEEQLQVLEQEDMQIRCLGECWQGQLKSWEEKSFAVLESQLRTMETALKEVPKGRLGELATLEISMADMRSNRLIQQVQERAELKIRSYLMGYKLLLGVWETLSEEWEMTENPEGREEDFFLRIRMQNEDDDRMAAWVYVDQDQLKTGRIRLILRLSLDSMKRDAISAERLRKTAAALRRTMDQPQYGHLQQFGDITAYREGGMPAVLMEYGPVQTQGTAGGNIPEGRPATEEGRPGKDSPAAEKTGHNKGTEGRMER